MAFASTQLSVCGIHTLEGSRRGFETERPVMEYYSGVKSPSIVACKHSIWGSNPWADVDGDQLNGVVSPAAEAADPWSVEEFHH